MVAAISNVYASGPRLDYGMKDMKYRSRRNVGLMDMMPDLHKNMIKIRLIECKKTFQEMITMHLGNTDVSTQDITKMIVTK